MTDALELYHSPVSTCSQKVRMVLEEKGLGYVSHLIDLQSGQQHDPDYVRLNPNHVVPTLVHGQRVILESMLISEYLEEVSAGPALMPLAPHDRYQVRLWAQFIDRVHAHAAVLTYSVGPRHMIIAQGPEAIEHYISLGQDERTRVNRRAIIEQGVASSQFAEALTAFVAMLDRMEAQLTHHVWLAGETFSLADTAAIPYVLRLDHLAMTALITDRPHVASWYETVKARPSYERAIGQHLSAPTVAALRSFGEACWPQVLALL